MGTPPVVRRFRGVSGSEPEPLLHDNSVKPFCLPRNHFRGVAQEAGEVLSESPQCSDLLGWVEAHGALDEAIGGLNVATEREEL